MKENLRFLQAFLKNPLKVGALAPSSDELAAEMLHGIVPDDDNIVMELGVGTGALTKHFKALIPSRDSYLGIELDADATGRGRRATDGNHIVLAGGKQRPNLLDHLQNESIRASPEAYDDDCFGVLPEQPKYESFEPLFHGRSWR